MKIIFLIYSFLFFCFVCYSQDELTITSFLSDANQEEFVSFQRQKLYHLNSLSFDLPYIEKLEFRTETNEFDIRKQEYLLRVTPNSFKNVRAQKQYNQSIQYMTEMELHAAFNSVLKERYHMMIDFVYLQEIMLIKNKQRILLNDQVILLKRSMELVDFDVLELIKATYDAQENRREILDLENSILTTEKSIQKTQKSDKPIVVKDLTLPTIKDVKTITAGISQDIEMKHPELELRSAQLHNNMLEHEMELSKSKFSIGYVQAEYGYDFDENFRNSFSLGIGFEVPLKGASAKELNQLKIDILERQSQNKIFANDLNKEAFSLRQKLNNQIKKYELVSLQLEKGEAELVLQEYQKIADASPHAMLKLRENTMKIELLLHQLQYEIMLTYIDYLDVMGLLYEKPLKNYLSKDLTELKY